MPLADAPHKRWLWLFGSVLVFSAASAFSFLGYMGEGITAGALIGLPGREREVLVYQQRATYWLVTSLVCQVGVVGFLVPLFRFISEEAKASSFGVRLGCSVIAAPVLTWVVGSTMLAVGHLLHGHF